MKFIEKVNELAQSAIRIGKDIIDIISMCVFPVVGIILSGLDVVTDFMLAKTFFDGHNIHHNMTPDSNVMLSVNASNNTHSEIFIERHVVWGALTLTFPFLPGVVWGLGIWENVRSIAIKQQQQQSTPDNEHYYELPLKKLVTGFVLGVVFFIPLSLVFTICVRISNIPVCSRLKDVKFEGKKLFTKFVLKETQLLEALFEATPQLCLQLYIIGVSVDNDITILQLLTITTSLISIAMKTVLREIEVRDNIPEGFIKKIFYHMLNLIMYVSAVLFRIGTIVLMFIVLTYWSLMPLLLTLILLMAYNEDLAMKSSTYFSASITDTTTTADNTAFNILQTVMSILQTQGHGTAFCMLQNLFCMVRWRKPDCPLQLVQDRVIFFSYSALISITTAMFIYASGKIISYYFLLNLKFQPNYI